MAHANRVRTRFEAGDLLDRETVKSLLATVLLTGASEPEICVTAITTLLRKCGFTKPEIARVKAGMQLEERITGGGSIFGWFGAAPPLPASPDPRWASRAEMLNRSMFEDLHRATLQGGDSGR